MTPIVHITDKERDLQAQLDHARECVKQMARMNELMVSELAEARVELDRLKADAERYEWLRRFDHFAIVDELLNSVEINTLDAAIDAAMKEQS